MSESPGLPGPAGLTALPGYEPMGDAVRPDTERWPGLDAAGWDRLAALRDHPHAPRWTHACGDLLTDDDRIALQEWAARLSDHESDRRPEPPDWLLAELDRLRHVVPLLRRLGVRGWEDVPLLSRADLVRAVADLVPVDVPLDRVVQGTSSGSTGSALVIPWHPVDIAKDLPLLEHLLRREGVDWRPDVDRMGLLSVVDQEQAFTYASLLTTRGDQTMARVSLHPSAWGGADPRADRAAFLAAARPQVVTGSALSLLALAAVVGADLSGSADRRLRPLAVVSGAVELSGPARDELSRVLGCPVLDLYGLREVGPVAVATSADGGHRLVPRRTHVEIVDAAGRPVPDGTPGEVVVSSVENPYLPLLRYRTGDRAALVGTGADRRLVGLEGREAVLFTAGSGRRVQSVELTQQMQRHGVLAWAVGQSADGGVTARCVGGDADAAGRALATLLDQPVTATALTGIRDLGPGKPRRFTSEA
ncbi:AMP-binding protein [Terracoccus luteus]|uniref:Phenylacetate-CoA ligase n=1 Tax=Terracoccus luteus TaxID=53356 RepID=A0A839PT77_9MICO|nr:AMP-binding protein [Terracoccus luteus]MBB2987380.1 phenylacetate-CoA ligase [Terracoccus luteus]MCP2173031.1 phenylacetate-CoA ligase [Terracoccus luteus]